MSDLTKAPYFSAYFPDPAVLPESAEALWRRGQINPEELLVSFTSKDWRHAGGAISGDGYTESNAWGGRDRVRSSRAPEDFPQIGSHRGRVFDMGGATGAFW